MTRRPPTLHIPDLSKAPGAEVDAYGDVRCITCGTHVPVGDADIVGLGYRCRACSEKATRDDDEAANLPPEERSLLKRLPKRSSFVIGGFALLAVAVLMWVLHIDLTWPGSMGRHSLFVWMIIGAAGCFGLATAPR